MDFYQIRNFLTPIGLILAGVIMKLSKNKETFGVFKKYWFLFIIGGVLLFLSKLFLFKIRG